MNSLFACGVDKPDSHHQVNLHGHQNLDDAVGFNYDNNSFSGSRNTSTILNESLWFQNLDKMSINNEVPSSC